MVCRESYGFWQLPVNGRNRERVHSQSSTLDGCVWKMAPPTHNIVLKKGSSNQIGILKMQQDHFEPSYELINAYQHILVSMFAGGDRAQHVQMNVISWVPCLETLKWRPWMKGCAFAFAAFSACGDMQRDVPSQLIPVCPLLDFCNGFVASEMPASGGVMKHFDDISLQWLWNY